MTFRQLSAYFQNYAALNLVLMDSPSNKSFVAVHSEKNADDFIRTCKSPTILVLITPDKKLFPPKGENYNWGKQVVFFVLQKCGRKTETVITNAQSDCEDIANDFVTQIIKDRHTLLTSIVEESITMQPVGPMTDDFYGQAVIFTLIDNFNQYVNPAKWAGAPPLPPPPVENTGTIVVEYADEHLGYDINGRQTYTAPLLVGKSGYRIESTQLGEIFRTEDISYDAAAGSFTILVPRFALTPGDQLNIFPYVLDPDS